MTRDRRQLALVDLRHLLPYMGLSRYARLRVLESADPHEAVATLIFEAMS